MGRYNHRIKPVTYALIALATLTFLAREGSAQDCAYVANLGSDTVSVISTATNQVATTIPVGHGPNGIATSRYGKVCVTNFDSDTVSIIDKFSQTVVATVPVGDGPVGIGRSGGTDELGDDIPQSFVYVANKNSATVSVIDVSRAEVIDTIPVDAIPTGIFAEVHGGRVYVTHATTPGLVSVIDTGTNQVMTTIPVGVRPGRIARADGSALYVTNFGSLDVTVISGDVVTETIGLGLKPSNVAVTPDGQSAYVTNFGLPLVTIIPTATNRPVANITVGSEPAAIAHIVNRGHGYTYVANSGSDDVSVIDRANDNTVVATIPVGDMPFAVAVGNGSCSAPIPTPVATPTPEVVACAGDCDGDDHVTVDEVLLALSIALGSESLDTCLAADSSDDGAVSVDDITRALNGSLVGCGE